MNSNRILIDGAFYHVSSRTNNKIRAFESESGKLAIMLTLEEAKEKYQFKLANFCVMPTHIHLLIAPAENTSLSKIMQWIKTISAKRWNFSRNCSGHLWGARFYSRVIKDQNDYDRVMNYIEQNPVEAGLCKSPAEWLVSGAFYTNLID